jgi:hypothetical protein
LGSESVYIGFSLFIGLNLMKKNWGGWKLSSLTTRGLCCSVKFYTCHVQFDLEVMNGRDGGILSQLTVLSLRKGYKLIGLLNYLVNRIYLIVCLVWGLAIWTTCKTTCNLSLWWWIVLTLEFCLSSQFSVWEKGIHW